MSHALTIVFVALGLGAIAAWSTEDVQKTAAQMFGELGMLEPLDRCAERASFAVAEACCLAHQEDDPSRNQSLYAARLMDDSSSPTGCMVQSMDGRDAVTNTIARTLASEWETTLADTVLAEDAAEEERQQVCLMANHLAHLDRIPNTMAPTRLLSCALRARDPVAEACCTQSLLSLSGGRNLMRTVLPDPVSLMEGELAERAPALLERLLPGTDPSEQARRAELAVSLGLDTQPMRNWSFMIACEGLDRNASQARDTIQRRLQTHMIASSCDVDDSSLHLTALRRGCDTWRYEPERTDVSASEAFCGVLSRGASSLAMRGATLGVFRGLVAANRRANGTSDIISSIADTAPVGMNLANQEHFADQLLTLEQLAAGNGDHLVDVPKDVRDDVQSKARNMRKMLQGINENPQGAQNPHIPKIDMMKTLQRDVEKR